MLLKSAINTFVKLCIIVVLNLYLLIFIYLFMKSIKYVYKTCNHVND